LENLILNFNDFTNKFHGGDRKDVNDQTTLGVYIRNMKVAAKVGSTVFFHGGLSLRYAQELEAEFANQSEYRFDPNIDAGLSKISMLNSKIRELLNGPWNQIKKRLTADDRNVFAKVLENYGPLSYRGNFYIYITGYASNNSTSICNDVESVLKLYGAKRMVITDTYTSDLLERVYEKCGKKIILVRNFGLLNIEGGEVTEV
jgi:hypothetical protein